MIHYHGGPMGGPRVDVARFLSGRHALIQFGRQEDLPVAMDVCQSFILDNGAFTHWKRGHGMIDFEAYFTWCTSIYRHPGFDWALIPDTIDGSEQDNIKLVNKWLRTGTRVKGVPVWHFHESFEYLDWLVNNFETVALGSSGEWSRPGARNWWDRMREVMAVTCDSLGVPKCKLHGLRMLNPAVFTKLPLSSADSANAAINSGSLERFGMYKPPSTSQRADVIASRIEAHNSAPFWFDEGS